MRTTTLKPGLLVAVSCKTRGGVEYRREDICAETEGKVSIRKWETTCITTDAAELARADKVRSACRYDITRFCINTGFGLLCPKESADDLWRALETARARAADFNATAVYHRVEVNALAGEIAATDEAAAREIAADLRELFDSMEKGIREMKPDDIRRAADQANALGRMLAEENAGKVSDAVKAARTAARRIVALAKEGITSAEAVILQVNTSPIGVARFAFLPEASQDAQAQAQVDDTAADCLPAADAARFAGMGV